MRAIAKKNEKKGIQGHDIAFIVKKEIVGRSFQEIQEIMAEALQKVPQQFSRI